MKHGCIYVDSLPHDAVEIPGFSNQFITPRGEIFAKFGRLKQRRLGLNRCGYPICGLRKTAGGVQWLIVHRIVAKLFVPGDQSLTVNHKDMIKSNCDASNLEWISLSDNHKHARANRKWKPSKGKSGVPLTATHPETGEQTRFASGVDAAKWVGNVKAAGNISKACVHGRVAYGFEWSKT